MFRTSVPVTEGGFHNRRRELERLRDVVRRLRDGSPSWLALVGPRKVGKTSLLLETARREQSSDIHFVVLDVLDTAPVSLEFFRLAAVRILDALLGVEIGLSLELLLRNPSEFRAALQSSPSFARLRPAERAVILELPEQPVDDRLLRFVLDLPERIAHAMQVYIVVAIDEFQELGAIGGAPDPFPLARSVWQRHRRVTYVVSGSARTMLTELVTSERSPFFQHFTLAEIGPFSEQDAIELLVRESPPDRQIPHELAEIIVRVIGCHPFYLQILGETIITYDPPYDERTLKEAMQEVLFSRTGRLALYFQNDFARLVGRSTHLAAMLESLAGGPRRISEVAAEIGQSSGSTVRYAERLGDAVVRRDDGLYHLPDATFATWIRWRRPGGTVVPMTLLGDEAEKSAAEHLARMGFDLIYQSRASRGAFDLLALRGATQLGIQVKRSPLPLRFPKSAWNRMEADAKHLGWRWIVIAVDPTGDVRALDPARARRAREARLHEDAIIDNVLAWLDR